jgi:hypothetical protein
MTLRLPDVAYDLDLSGLVRKQWKEMVLKGRIYPLSPVGNWDIRIKSGTIPKGVLNA